MLLAPARQYATSPVLTIAAGAPLQTAWERMEHHGLSCFPVLDERARPMGVIALSDLARMERIEVGADGRPTLVLPADLDVRDAATPSIVTVSSGASIAEAARLLLDHRIHRVFLERDGALIAVLSTLDVARAIVDAELALPISAVMSSPVLVVNADDSLVSAVAALEKAKIDGIAVRRGPGIAGIFTRLDALRAQHRPLDTTVGEVMGRRFLAVPASEPMHSAAKRLIDARVRRLLITNDGSVPAPDLPDGSSGHLVGIATGIDLAGATLMG